MVEGLFGARVYIQVGKIRLLRAEKARICQQLELEEERTVSLIQGELVTHILPKLSVEARSLTAEIDEKAAVKAKDVLEALLSKEEEDTLVDPTRAPLGDAPSPEPLRAALPSTGTPPDEAVVIGGRPTSALSRNPLLALSPARQAVLAACPPGVEATLAEITQAATGEDTHEARERTRQHILFLSAQGLVERLRKGVYMRIEPPMP